MSDNNKKAKDFVKSTILRKKAPKGVDPAKHERCVKNVKEQGKDVGSAHAICTSSMKKSDFIDKFKRDKFVTEFMDDNAELMDALAESEQKDKAKDFAKDFKKSYDYRNHGVMIDSKDQQAAEETTNPKLIEYIKSSMSKSDINEVQKIPLGEGTLTLTKKDQGLYNGFWQDKDGQVMEKFDDQTAEIVAKNMVVKGWVGEETIPEEIVMADPEPVDAAPSSHPSYVRVKCGDFEFELRKSLKDFAKAWNSPGQDDIKKAVNIWKRHRVNHITEKQAVKEILKNWDQFGEDFSQMLFAVQKTKGE